MTPCKQTVFNFKNMPAEYLTLAAMLKPLRTRRKPPNPNKIIFLSDEKNFKQDGKNRQNARYLCSDHEDVPLFLHYQDYLNANLMIERNVAA
jgi:hypothetical protein